jgi:hypothetical protein
MRTAQLFVEVFRVAAAVRCQGRITLAAHGRPRTRPFIADPIRPVSGRWNGAMLTTWCRHLRPER